MTNQRTLTLRSLDVPSIHKFGIGFDSMFNELLRTTQQNQTTYPPYNIVKETEDKFRIEVATAGFNEGEVKVELNNRLLSIRGSKAVTRVVEDAEVEAIIVEEEYLHQGISKRDFEREFTLAEHVKVVDATNVNGILTVFLERQVPEEARPKTIDIKYLK
jgi:molecular chaperone IbpA